MGKQGTLSADKDIPRWNAHVLLFDGNANNAVELEDFTIYGILAEDRAGASTQAWEKAFTVLQNVYNGMQAGCRILSIDEVGKGSSVPIGTKKKRKLPKIHPPYIGRKPFSCPIVDLCTTKKVGRLFGTSMSVSAWPEATSKEE